MPKSAWEQARRALVFYFSRRHGVADAEDLAQETLACLWSREDFEFEKESDFLLVCYGFARRILQRRYRDKAREPADLEQESPPVTRSVAGLNEIEIGVLLAEVREAASSQLKPREWELIQMAATADRGALGAKMNVANATNVRVQLHRARRKLAEITGWKSK